MLTDSTEGEEVEETCALGDLTMHNLAYTAVLLDCQCPSVVVSMNIPFIS
jgi:hypothetical protein